MQLERIERALQLHQHLFQVVRYVLAERRRPRVRDAQRHVVRCRLVGPDRRRRHSAAVLLALVARIRPSVVCTIAIIVVVVIVVDVC